MFIIKLILTGFLLIMPKTAKIADGKAKTIGYLRVSTFSQELEKNKADILALANNFDLGKVAFVEEVVSGKVSWRKRKIAEILDDLKVGDSIIVSELSRLGRSMARMYGDSLRFTSKRRSYLCGKR